MLLLQVQIIHLKALLPCSLIRQLEISISLNMMATQFLFLTPY